MAANIAHINMAGMEEQKKLLGFKVWRESMTKWRRT